MLGDENLRPGSLDRFHFGRAPLLELCRPDEEREILVKMIPGDFQNAVPLDSVKYQNAAPETFYGSVPVGGGGQGDQIKQGTIRALPKTISTANERKWARIQSISYFESEVGG